MYRVFHEKLDKSLKHILEFISKKVHLRYGSIQLNYLDLDDLINIVKKYQTFISFMRILFS